MAFRRRLWAQESTTILTETTVKVVSHLAGGPKGVVSKLGKLLQKSPTASVKSGSLRWYGQHVVKELLAHGKTVSEAADIVWLTAIAGIGVPVGLVSETRIIILSQLLYVLRQVVRRRPAILPLTPERRPLGKNPRHRCPCRSHKPRSTSRIRA